MQGKGSRIGAGEARMSVKEEEEGNENVDRETER
jgi:hypothetical protein